MIFMKTGDTDESVRDYFDELNVQNGLGWESTTRKMVWPTPPVPFNERYLTFTAREDCTFKFSGSVATNTLEYSTDSGTTWTELSNNTYTSTISSGNSISWRATGLTPTNTYGIGKFVSTGTYDISGNVMSLLYGAHPLNKTDLSDYPNAFRYLFSGNTGITSAENLSLPATKLSSECYYGMFQGCTSLTTAPKLPAKDLNGANSCYRYMFYSCTTLTAAPELPAEILSTGCYQYMFYQCRSLTTAPELPAFTLTPNCYGYMFYYCSSLTTAPKLPAQTLASSCYQNMFYYCTALTSIECMAEDTRASNCTSNWVYGLPTGSSFIFKVAPGFRTGTTLTNNSSAGTLTGWSIQWVYSAAPLTFIAQEDCTFSFIKSVTSNTVQYSIDSGATWETISDSSTTVSVPSGYSVMWKSSASNLTTTISGGIGRFVSEGRYEALGCPGSLYSGYTQGSTTYTSPTKDYAFLGLFSGSTGLTKANRLSLRDGNSYSHAHTFEGCTNLRYTPMYKDVNVAYAHEFESMFEGCTSLKIFPMFDLYRTYEYCFANQFRGCTGITEYVTEPREAGLAGNEDQTAQYSNYHMFDGCKSLIRVPALLVETIGPHSFEGMFSGCSSLSSITCYALNNSYEDCTKGWLAGVAAVGTFTKPNLATWNSGVNGIPTGWGAVVDYACDPLTFTAQETTSFSYTGDFELYYSTDSGQTWTVLSTGTSITVTSGNSIFWKMRGGSGYLRTNFSSNGRFIAFGNTASAERSSYRGKTSSDCEKLFAGCTGLTSINNMVIDRTGTGIHEYMFQGCTGLVTVPADILPATSIKQGRYCYYMFGGCTSLTTAPNLPATALSAYCYYGMFANCTSLTTAPNLPATTLANYCYQYMFSGCTSLNYVKCLARNGINTNSSTGSWLNGVSSSGTFIKSPNTTVSTGSTGSGSVWPRSYNGIPTSWTYTNQT